MVQQLHLIIVQPAEKHCQISCLCQVSAGDDATTSIFQHHIIQQANKAIQIALMIRVQAARAKLEPDSGIISVLLPGAEVHIPDAEHCAIEESCRGDCELAVGTLQTVQDLLQIAGRKGHVNLQVPI